MEHVEVLKLHADGTHCPGWQKPKSMLECLVDEAGARLAVLEHLKRNKGQKGLVVCYNGAYTNAPKITEAVISRAETWCDEAINELYSYIKEVQQKK